MQKYCIKSVPLDLFKQLETEMGMGTNWHSYVTSVRGSRDDVRIICDWITENIPKKSSMLEIGCGCGQNLLWFAEQGYSDLAGQDSDQKVLNVATILSRVAKLPVHFFKGKAFEVMPQRRYDLIFFWNILHVIYDSEECLHRMFEVYSDHLTSSGILVFDVIDSSFNAVPGNEYEFVDLKLPIEQRRPSPYLFRISKQQVIKIAETWGYTILHVESAKEQPKRVVFCVQKS